MASNDPTDPTEADEDDAGADTAASVPPPADFDPAEHPSNPDLVDGDE